MYKVTVHFPDSTKVTVEHRDAETFCYRVSALFSITEKDYVIGMTRGNYFKLVSAGPLANFWPMEVLQTIADDLCRKGIDKTLYRHIRDTFSRVTAFPLS